MSDVWQGPGWWLASDGKWYPADAEPGAVYEGDLSNDDQASPGASDEIAEIATDSDVGGEIPSMPATEQAAEPVVEAPAAEIAPDAPSSVPESSVPESSVPESSMPDPIVEAGGGWQAVGPVADPVPEPDIEAAVFAQLAASDPDAAPTKEEDGWTSAFEERQASGEVLDDLPRTPETLAGATPLVPSAPIEPTVPDVSVPDVSVPDVSVPDVSVPEVSVPDVSVPDVSVPDVSVPDVTVPDVSVPDVTVPDVSVPDVTVPEVSVPDVTVPDVTVPDVTVPDVTVPDVTVPDVTVPDVTVPDVTVPNVTVPDVTVPNVTVPEVTVPEVTVPDAPAAVVPPTEASVDDVMALAGTAPVTTSIPIERQDAWRKPLTADSENARADITTPRGTPDVVDLAIPQDAPPQEIEAPKRNWRMWAGILAVIALIALIAWFIAMLFSGNSTGDNNTETTDSSTTSSAQVAAEDTSAPATDADPETSTETTADTVADSPSTTQASVFDLRAGDCIVGDIGAGQVTKVEKVECEAEHQFEVYREALIESSITTFDEAAISAYAEDVCRTSLAAYVPADDERNLKFKFLQPTEDSWNQAEDPDRVITCLLFDGDGDPLIGRAN